LVGEGGALVFTPANLTIHVGDTVRWVWGSSGHSGVSGTNGNADNQFCSPVQHGVRQSSAVEQGDDLRAHLHAGGYGPVLLLGALQLGMTGTITVQ